jgi:hypothetical protein
MVASRPVCCASGAHRSSFQSILLPVREADAIVDEFRVEGDWSRRLGIPAHLTLAGPWPLSQQLPRQSLAGLAAQARGSKYRLDLVDLLGGAICLLPRDDRPLLSLRARLLSTVGKPDAVSPAWRLHLTISRTEPVDRLAAVRRAIDHALPLDCEVRDLYIARMIEPGRVVTERL